MKKALWPVLIVCMAAAFLARIADPATLHQVTSDKEPANLVPGKSQHEEKATLSAGDDTRSNDNRHAKLDDLMFQSWLLRTPEIDDGIRRARTRRLTRLYQDAFSSLNLSEDKSLEAIGIVLRREANKYDLMKQLRFEGFSKGAKKFADSYKKENQIAEMQLRLLLDDEQYKKLADLERKMTSKTMSEAADIISRLKKK